jgi:pyridoxine 5-phosphate synthase
MIKLSVNINKIATIRNARGGNIPDIIEAAISCELFGAHGITVHPRPDERHIRYADVRDLKNNIKGEFNIEGNPSQEFMDLVLSVKPHQVTLVPDRHDAITSDAGWDTIKYQAFLADIISELKNANIRSSIFIDTDAKFIEAAAKTETDRIELYTGPYAHNYTTDKEMAIEPFKRAAHLARSLHIGINAGHDLNLKNLEYLATQIPFIDEVSIGHALISDALYFGLGKTIRLYIDKLI